MESMSGGAWCAGTRGEEEDRCQPYSSTAPARRLVQAAPVLVGDGIEFGTIGGPPSNRWVTIRGSLLCDRGSVMGYALGNFHG